MLTSSGPKLIEYNVRFGDPECEAIMPLIEGDFAELLNAVAAGRLSEIAPPKLSLEHAMTVIVAASGYPGNAGERWGHPGDRSRGAGRRGDGVSRRHCPRRPGACREGRPRSRGYGNCRHVRQCTSAGLSRRRPDRFRRRLLPPRHRLARAVTRERVNAFWTYFWPPLGAGLVCRSDRRRLRLPWTMEPQ